MPIKSQESFIELVTRYHEKPESFVFFVGAGLSQPLFPSWAVLLRKLVNCAKENGLPHDSDELLQHIDKGERYIDIAEACVSAIGKSRYRDIMEEVFDIDFSLDKVPEGYRALMGLSPKAIITTNYDRIPDIAGQGLYRVCTNKNAAETARALANDKNVVFKVHGDITDQSSIVLTTSDYQNIMHGNQSTKGLLNTLLTSRTIIFIGFSLSDPHIDMLLESVKSIYGGIPISHYVLLHEQSSFKISAFEKKYGLKVISYTPTDASHPEVSEFLRALNHEAKGILDKQEILKKALLNDSESLLSHMESVLREVIVNAGFSIFYDENILYLSFSPAGETKSEIQKEILSIVKLMNFDSELINQLRLTIYANTQPGLNLDESQATLLSLEVKFSDAKNYAEKNISTSTLWKQIVFYAPDSLSNPFQNAEKIDFPLSMGIVEV